MSSNWKRLDYIYIYEAIQSFDFIRLVYFIYE
jgi:hypothetical protein